MSLVPEYGLAIFGLEFLCFRGMFHASMFESAYRIVACSIQDKQSRLARVPFDAVRVAPVTDDSQVLGDRNGFRQTSLLLAYDDPVKLAKLHFRKSRFPLSRFVVQEIVEFIEVMVFGSRAR